MSTIAAGMRNILEAALFPRSRYSRLVNGINAAVDRYAGKKSAAGQQEFRWITIGGASGDKGEHEGGTPVKIEKATGKIVAGPKALADKGVEKLSDFGKKGEGGATTEAEAKQPKPAAPEYVKPSSVDTPTQGALNSAKQQKAAAWKRVQDLRQKVKDAGPMAGGLRLDLLKAESKHAELVRAEKSAKKGIEARAAELGQTTVKPKPAGPKSFAEIGAEHTAPIVADMKSGDMNAASQKFDALMGQTKAKQFEAHMLRQKLQDEAGIKQKTRAERKAEAAGKPAAVPKTDPKSPKAGDVYDFPAVGDRSPVGLRVSAVGDSHVGVGMMDSDQTWVKIPKESFHSFVQDMSGKIDVPETDDPHISRIRSGEAKMLGRGDDGLVFDTGDGKVTKVSTTTPFQPLNPFHRTPDEAKKRAIDQFNTAKALHQSGVPGIPRMSAKEHGDRVFTTRENLKIPEKLTADQLRQTRDSLRAMHDQGYSLNDEVQVGIGADGKVYHFDLGKAAKAEHPDDFKGDQSRLDRLAEKSGLPRIAINPQKEWGEYKGMLDNRKASDERRQQQVKDGDRPASQAKSLVENFRRIVGENLARLRDQMVSENPSDADRIRAEHAEMMGEAATPPAAPVPQSPPPKPTVAGTQSGLFDRDEMTTGQKSLFNVVRPAKGGAKKPVAPDLLAGVTADVRAHLERKGTLSPADVSGTNLQAESLEGQKEMFSRIRGAMARGVARYRLTGGSRY